MDSDAAGAAQDLARLAAELTRLEIDAAILETEIRAEQRQQQDERPATERGVLL